MKGNDFYQAVKTIRGAVRNLIDAGYSESSLKRIVGFAIIHELFADKTEEERIDFILNSDFFFDYYLKNIPIDERSAESILKDYGIYTPAREEKLNQQLRKTTKRKHNYNDFFE